MPDNDVTLVSNYTTDFYLQYVFLEKGWNFIAVTCMLDEESCAELLAFRPMAYNAETEGLAFATVNEVTPGNPLWIYSKEDMQLILYGMPVTGWTLALQPGWNFVGAVEDVARWQLPTDASVWQWNGERCELVDGGLEAGRAYLIKVDGE